MHLYNNSVLQIYAYARKLESVFLKRTFTVESSKMVDSDDDELMALAGIASDENNEDEEYEPEVKTSRRSTKRQINEDEENDIEDMTEEADPYPLEGKFKNEEDREKLMAMDEVTREQILYDRMQEKEKKRERRYLALRARQNQVDSSAMRATGSKNKRLRTSKLSELKRQRERKSKQRSQKDDDDHIEDLLEDDDEDDRDLDELAGYGNEGDEDYYSDEYEPTAGRKKGKSASSWEDYEDKYQQEATLADFNQKVRSSRSLLSKYIYRDEFDVAIPGSYVRVSIGPSPRTGKQQYRIAKVEEIKRHGTPYKLFGKECNTYLNVSQGNSSRVISLAYVSNSPFSEEEFEIYKKRLTHSDMDIPSVGEVEDKFSELRAMSTKKLTNEDINKMVAKKQDLIGSMDSTSRVRRLAGLREELQAALEKVELEKVKQLTKQIEDITRLQEKIEVSNKMSRINQRNKRSNEVLIKRAEQRKLELEQEQENKIEEDPNDPFSKLALEDVDDSADASTSTEKSLATCRFKREGIESVINTIPLEIDLKP